MAAAFVKVSKIGKNEDGDVVMRFRKIDSTTQRAAGEPFISSPITSIEPVKDAYGVVAEGDNACMMIRTDSGSAYVTVMPKMAANKLQKYLLKKKS